MDISQVVDWSREAIRLTLILGGPFLLISLVVAGLVAVGQTVTQLQDPVSGFVLRLIAVGAAMLFLLPWFLDSWAQFTSDLVTSIPDLILKK